MQPILTSPRFFAAVATRATQRRQQFAAAGFVAALLAALFLVSAAPADAHELLPAQVANSYQLPVPAPAGLSATIGQRFNPPAQKWLAGHRGVDLYVFYGSTVRSPAPGYISFSGKVAGKPVVTVTHYDGLRSSFEPVNGTGKVGASVTAGSPIGTVGFWPTGTASHCPASPLGACVHWGVRRGDIYLDPLSLLGSAPPIVLLPSDSFHPNYTHSVRRMMFPRTRILIRVLILGLLFTVVPRIAATATPTIPDPQQRGSLTINKHYLPLGKDTQPNGMPQNFNAANNPPIPGVEFTIWRVVGFDPDGTGPQPSNQFDLLSTESWLAADKLTPPQALSEFAVLEPVPAGTQRTDARGQARFNNLPIGLYLVRETAAPTNFDHDGDPATPVRSVVPAAPFLVTIPITNPVAVDGAAPGTLWLYDVYAYPKSAEIAINKTSDFDELPSGTKVGDPVTFTLIGEIPERGFDTYGKREIFEKYQIEDVLDPRLHLNTSSVRVTIPETPEIKLTSGTDYTTTTTANTVKVDFTSTGLAKLNAALPDIQRVRVKFSALATTLGEIPNGGPTGDEGTSTTLTVRTGQDARNGDLPTPPRADISVHSPEIEVRFGGETLWKYGTNAPTIGLPGATFRVFRSEADALAYAEDPVTYASNSLKFFTSETKPKLIETIDYGNPVPTVTTDDDGRAFIAGLKYGDYWVLETKAPADENVQYQLLPKPFKITIDSGLDGARGSALSDDTTVFNVPDNAGFQLPMTGGDGYLLPVVIGILVLGIAAALALEARRVNASVNHLDIRQRPQKTIWKST